MGIKYNRALAQHWDGSSWSRVPTPLPDPGGDDSLKGVDGAASDDVWAVGYSQGSGFVVPLVMHWDGDAWTKVPVDLPFGNTFGVLRGMVAISPTDVWAVGVTGSPRDASLLLHWDGETWEPSTHVLAPDDDVVGLLAVDAVSSDDVWAVGGATLHWDGQIWSQVAYTGRDRFYDALFGVTAIAADDVWAVGGYGDDTDPNHTQILHWDGTRWSRVDSPDPGKRDNALWAVSASGPDDAWAASPSVGAANATSPCTGTATAGPGSSPTPSETGWRRCQCTAARTEL